MSNLTEQPTLKQVYIYEASDLDTLGRTRDAVMQEADLHPHVLAALNEILDSPEPNDAVSAQIQEGGRLYQGIQVNASEPYSSLVYVKEQYDNPLEGRPARVDVATWLHESVRGTISAARLGRVALWGPNAAGHGNAFPMGVFVARKTLIGDFSDKTPHPYSYVTVAEDINALDIDPLEKELHVRLHAMFKVAETNPRVAQLLDFAGRLLNPETAPIVIENLKELVEAKKTHDETNPNQD